MVKKRLSHIGLDIDPEHVPQYVTIYWSAELSAYTANKPIEVAMISPSPCPEARYQ